MLTKEREGEMKYSSARRVIGGQGLGQAGSAQDLWNLERY